MATAGVACPTCGTELRAGAKFCHECGSPTGESAKPAEYKQVTVLFADVVRSMDIAAAVDIERLRGIIVETAREYGLAPIAASTHPFARSTRQMPTEKEQFFALAREMQAAARRLMVCGMHVHVGIDDDDLRVDLMNQLSYFIPHVLALSCSSPFWEGERTGDIRVSATEAVAGR